jgi:glycerol-3-phosphate acyltransferase PlsX
MRIAIDGMGGDHAPEAVVAGAAQAASDWPDLELIVVGQAERVQPLVERHPGLRFRPATQVIAMDEHPAQAVRTKTDSSMSVCARMCKQGEAAAWVSAGNSGAIMAAALFLQGRIRGVERPALGSVVPTAEGQAYFLDVGANVDSRPEFLVQFAHMGSVYARELMQRAQPRVGLLANGEEDSKGDELTREVNARLRRNGTGLNFVGNIEPKEVFEGKADVVVADGFLGNVAIKMAEATADFLFRNLREEIPSTVTGKIGGALIRPGVRRIRSRVDWREFGGAPLLGIDGVAVVAHGRSDARAFRNAIRVAREAVQVRLVDKIREAVAR